MPPDQVSTLADPAGVKAGLPLCLIGDSGTGKSHLLIAIASNAPFSEWKQTFTDPRLCAAIVDRDRHRQLPLQEDPEDTASPECVSVARRSARPVPSCSEQRSECLRGRA
ncbi:hypothetical protein ABZZ20_20660 [Streptomyces sp. NPDC006430]|uniref:hypothetical protein n=1 Tax=Streptomyces sp. NPDC006430 TaxID=3154299 RepID=UPI0033BF1C76